MQTTVPGSPPSQPTPARMTLWGVAAADVAIGDQHICVIDMLHRVLCWGDDTFGELGDRNVATTPHTSVVQAQLPAGAMPSEIAASAAHTCAVAADAVYCWGSNDQYQLGTMSAVTTTSPLTPVLAMAGAQHVAAGAHSTCAVLGDGTVQCWGSNSMYQLGDGTGSTRSRPTPMGIAYHPDAAFDGSALIGLSAGEGHVCAIRRYGGVICWGANASGQLGDGTTTSRGHPVIVSHLP
jgi:alpha-tubulin suppressor-like RCC1 family protein